MATALPRVESRLPGVPIAVRVATMADLPFMDGLQKAHSKALGFFPRAQMEGYVREGWVLVAEEGGGSPESLVPRPGLGTAGLATRDAGPGTRDFPRPARPLGYLASRDRYLKRDELGIIYQLCVAPGRQRSLVGATLLQAAFDRSARGCKLYCCWCAQDLPANRFWEAMGFVPIAFRTGSRRGESRVPGPESRGGSEDLGQGTRDSGRRRPGHGPRTHIFWQKRIRQGDEGPGATPYWYPSKTDQGAMRADRLVFPIPPGLHWSDPMPVMASVPPPPEEEATGASHQLEGAAVRPRPRKRKVTEAAPLTPPPPAMPVRARVQFGAPGAAPVMSEPAPAAAPDAAEAEAPKPKRAKKPAAPGTKCDPKLIAAARELRDRWMDAVQAGMFDPALALTPGSDGGAKYDVSRLPGVPAAGGDDAGEARLRIAA